ncbi:MAG: alpha/beta hydrolase [Flavobacteriaceae bacterium]|nr:alpha/beta hydrolase [Flavobacteriaceae bacterium]
MENLKEEGKFKYIEKGEGTPIIILHGLMGGLSNFDTVIDFFSEKGYRVLIPELPIYSLPLLKTNVKELSKFLYKFMEFKEIKEALLLGNSLGGHIALYFANLNPEKVKGLLLTGSSGLYENSMGDTYPKRGNYEYIKQKTQEVFYDPNVASKELVDEVFDIVNSRIRAIKIISIAKSAIRHNMSKELPSMKMPTCLIWGKNDKVTPPDVAESFNELLPDSQLFWIDKCGHAPMMEHPEEFNQILFGWLKERGL